MSTSTKGLPDPMSIIKPLPVSDLMSNLYADPVSPTGLAWRTSGRGRSLDGQAGIVVKATGNLVVRFQGVPYSALRVLYAITTGHDVPVGHGISLKDGGRQVDFNNLKVLPLAELHAYRSNKANGSRLGDAFGCDVGLND